MSKNKSDPATDIAGPRIEEDGSADNLRSSLDTVKAQLKILAIFSRMAFASNVEIQCLQSRACEHGYCISCEARNVLKEIEEDEHFQTAVEVPGTTDPDVRLPF